MITLNYETSFSLAQEEQYILWVEKIVKSENFRLGEINYIFCDDDFLHKINLEYLDHDTLTDIISFDYSKGEIISGDIFISVERVRENASELDVSFKEEVLRVMAHGILHYCGFKDKTEEDSFVMRKKENEKIAMFQMEQ